MVPSYFQFSIDRRILPNEKTDLALNEITNHIDKSRNNIKSSVDIYVVNRIEPAMNPGTRLLSKLVNAVEKY